MNKSKKGRKGKASTEADATVSAEGMTKEQLWEEAIRAQEELDRVREEKRCFQLERDKALAGLEISVKKLDDLEAALRRVRGQNKDDRRAEIAVLKEKFKHVLSEQNNLILEMKIDGAARTSLVQNQFTGAELELVRDIQCLQAEYNERKLHRDELIKELELKHQTNLMKVNHSCECQLRGIEARYETKRQYMVQQAQNKLQEQLQMTYEKLRNQESVVTDECDKELLENKYQTLLMEVNLESESHLQKCWARNEKWSAVQEGKTEAKLQKQFEKLNDKLKSLESSPTKEHENVLQLEDEPKQLNEEEKPDAKMLPDRQQRSKQKESEQLKNLQEPQQNRVMMMRHRAEKQKIEKELREVTVEHELLFQACDKLQKERDEMVKRQAEVMLEVRQKNGLKKMLLERKVAVVAEELEKAEAQLCGVLAIASPDPTERSSAARRLEEIMNSKQAIIDGYQEALDEERVQHGGLPKNHAKEPPTPGTLRAARPKR